MKRITHEISRAKRALVLTLLLGSILIPVFIQAREFGEYKVRSAVETWVRYVTADARPDAVIERMEPRIVHGEVVAYIAHLMGGGFCLCGADDLALPVYLYSPQGAYDPENPNYQYILWEIETRAESMRNWTDENNSKLLPYLNAIDERSVLWQELMAGRIPTAILNHRASLTEPVLLELDLASCCWNQSSPYNDQCPELTPGADEHCVVGCIATAMTQIMYYWKWPYTGQGTGSTTYHYRRLTNWIEEPLATNPGIPAKWGAVTGFPDGRLNWTPNNGGRLRMTGYWDGSILSSAKHDENITNKTAEYLAAVQALYDRLVSTSTYCYANFGLANYDWGIIKDSHTDPPDAGDAEVAEVCYHGAVACEMGFGAWGSGSNGTNLRNALVDHFYYDSDATETVRDMYAMTNELNWIRPVAIGGGHPDGGAHEMAVCGYDKGTDPMRSFLINMGWRNCPVNWYTWDNFPFPVDPLHVIRIAPRNVVKFVGDTNPGDGSPNNPYEDIEEAIVEAPDGATLIFKAGSDNTFSSATLLINRPFTLKGYDATLRKE